MKQMMKAFLKAVAAAFVLAAMPAWPQGAPSLLSPEAGPSSPANPGRGVVRSARVAPDKGVLAQLRAQFQKPNGPSTLVLKFFDDKSFVVRIDSAAPVGLGATSYYGHVVGRNDGHALIVELNGNININVETEGRRYEVRWFGDQGSFAREVDLSGIPEHPPGGAPEVNIRPLPPPKPKVAGMSVEPVAQTVEDGSQMDVMVLYTPAASAAQGGDGPMNLLIDTAIGQVNAIYQNSNVVQRLRLVYKGPITHTEVDMFTDLDAFADKEDGILDNAHILRDAYGADFVTLVGVYTDGCDNGYVMSPESSGAEAFAFNIVARDCVGGGSSLAHALGHNMGLKHDNYYSINIEGVSTDTKVSPEGAPVDPGTTTIYYAHGYIDTVHRFRTVMSYNRQCKDLGYGDTPGCYPIPYFSNPAINVQSPYDNAVVPSGDGSNIDGQAANERQVLNDTRETTANFRAPVNTTNAPGTVVFMPKTYSVAESGGTVALTVARLVGSTGAISAFYETANGSATAGSDYLATSGTLTWANGDTSTRTVNVQILTDGAIEGPETFTVALSAPTGGAIIGPNGGTATVTIIDGQPDGFPATCTLGAVPAGFTTSAPSQNWRAVNDVYFGGPCGLSSAPITAQTQGTDVMSDLQYFGTFAAGTISFNYRVSALSGYGYIEFFIDNQPASFSVTGETGWMSFSAPIASGSHTLTWRFRNSLNFACRFFAGASDSCADRAWIDNLIMPINTAVTLSSVVTRKNHPNAGVWDRAVDPAQLVTGNVTTEPRAAVSGNHTVAFIFNTGIASAGSVTCVDQNNNPIGTCTVAAAGTAAVVTIGGNVPNNRRVKISLTNVNGNAANNFTASIGLLLGDVNGDRAVTASDILTAKGRLGQTLGAGNYASDVNVSGTLTQLDVDTIKVNAGLSLN